MYERFPWFKNSDILTNKKPWFGRTSMTRNDENNEIIRELVLSDPELTTDQLSESSGLS